MVSQLLSQAGDLIVEALLLQTREQADKNRILLNNKELLDKHIASNILDDVELRIFVKEKVATEITKLCQTLNESLPDQIIELELALKKMTEPSFDHYK